MFKFLGVVVLSMTLTGVALASDEAAEEAPTPDEAIAQMEAACAEGAEARAERHAATPLYERLGKDEKIHALLEEILRLHLENDAVKHFFEGEDHDAFIENLTKFVIAGTGGPQVYEGRPSLAEAHKDMHLTNADFVAAGGDIIQAMKNLEYGQNEIDEIMCSLLAMRTQVVLDEETEEVEETEQSE